ncbi:MAG: bifunctional heptose 7-phosphate kinase/heptose 1-phosphate adenyltransferase [Candidatus Aminicenantaceae bacterium]
MDKETKNLLNIIDNFSQKEIAVWGDLILDEYIFGDTRRISREAPVLILSYQSKELSLGGAGNSILNLKSLGAEPVPVGIIGADDSGNKIKNMLQKKGISTKYIIVDKNYQTPIKTRILAGEGHTRKQQILRIDRETKVPEDSILKQKIKQNLKSVRDSFALLISDYNYFSVKEDVFKQILPLFRKANVPVTLDSRFRLLNFQGITAATPNEPEVEEALRIKINDNPDILKKAGRIILRKIQSTALLITRGSKGMMLFEKDKTPFSIPIQGTTDIVDVTGAGDTVISVLTLALACGASFRQAAQLANYAGGIVVMKKGTATITPLELQKTISS